MFFLFFFAGRALFAQSTADEIEMLLGTRAVTYSQAARFLLEAAEVFATRSPQEAFRYAAERNWLPKNAEPDQVARLDGVSLLYMNSFDIKGGLFYMMTKNPHYAYRELVYRNYIQGRTEPGMNVSGELLLFMTGRIIAERDREAAIRDAALAEQRRVEDEQRRLKEAEEEAQRRRLAEEEAERIRIAEAEAAARREELAAEITAVLIETQTADTTVEATTEGVVITMSNVRFMADSTILQDSEMAKLRDIANILRNIPGIRLMVGGHSALAGTEESMYSVSLGRAQAVADYLVSLGAVRAENVTAVGYGASRPVADNSTPEGMEANRRVEISILED